MRVVINLNPILPGLLKTSLDLGGRRRNTLAKYREQSKIDLDKNSSLLREAVDQYAMQWAELETVELSVLSPWKEVAKGLIEERVSKIKQNFKHRYWQGVAKC